MAVVILASHPKLSAHSGSNFAQFAHLRAAAESRESASKYASISICENWCDTKSVSEHRDRRWQFWVKIWGQGGIFPGIASALAPATDIPTRLPNSNSSLGCPALSSGTPVAKKVFAFPLFLFIHRIRFCMIKKTISRRTSSSSTVGSSRPSP